MVGGRRGTDGRGGAARRIVKHRSHDAKHHADHPAAAAAAATATITVADAVSHQERSQEGRNKRSAFVNRAPIQATICQLLRVPVNGSAPSARMFNVEDVQTLIVDAERSAGLHCLPKTLEFSLLF